MNKKIALALFAVSALFSAWLYLNSDFQIEKTITAKEWQSKMVTVISDNLQEEAVGPLRKVDVVSNVKYLPNGTYIRVATIRLFAHSDQSDSVINISETGDWEISDNYLLISPKEFKDVSSAQSKDFSDVQLQLIKQLFKMDSQQSRRIDIVNEKTLLLTSLSHGSTVLFSN
ncbi:transmembrane regulatory protein ToxS [Vibrio ichthyoenteri ATCC 700023]|uniref:Transmembrane regulatory protein ToxS n=1 Tax=Vibrio ichthyoenteri ATCC 700023 TaxID=870968 RepID=F9S5B8_9VIBR|nr:regulatory protein ToxS [Vibrio ichthyoenteri]EGU35929.1 transmembrane regulatory protein ToxS [Vibrio ichthyoenteri ATCC 700023]